MACLFTYNQPEPFGRTDNNSIISIVDLPKKLDCSLLTLQTCEDLYSNSRCPMDLPYVQPIIEDVDDYLYFQFNFMDFYNDWDSGAPTHGITFDQNPTGDWLVNVRLLDGCCSEICEENIQNIGILTHTYKLIKTEGVFVEQTLCFYLSCGGVPNIAYYTYDLGLTTHENLDAFADVIRTVLGDPMMAITYNNTIGEETVNDFTLQSEQLYNCCYYPSEIRILPSITEMQGNCGGIRTFGFVTENVSLSPSYVSQSFVCSDMYISVALSNSLLGSPTQSITVYPPDLNIVNYTGTRYDLFMTYIVPHMMSYLQSVYGGTITIGAWTFNVGGNYWEVTITVSADSMFAVQLLGICDEDGMPNLLRVGTQFIEPYGGQGNNGTIVCCSNYVSNIGYENSTANVECNDLPCIPVTINAGGADGAYGWVARINERFYQTIRIPTAGLPDSFQFVFETPDGQIFFTEPYCKVKCNDDTIKLRGFYPANVTDCEGNYYGTPTLELDFSGNGLALLSDPNASSLSYENTYRFRGNKEWRSVVIEREATESRALRNISKDQFKILSMPLPPYAVHLIKPTILGTINAQIHDNGVVEELVYEGNMDKNLEAGTMWSLELTANSLRCFNDFKCGRIDYLY